MHEIYIYNSVLLGFSFENILENILCMYFEFFVKGLE